MINFVVFVRLTIVCDHPDCQRFAVYHGQSEQDCVDIARSYGWHVGHDGSFCPMCQEAYEEVRMISIQEFESLLDDMLYCGTRNRGYDGALSAYSKALEHITELEERNNSQLAACDMARFFIEEGDDLYSGPEEADYQRKRILSELKAAIAKARGEG